MFKITEQLATHGLGVQPDYTSMKYVDCEIGGIDSFRIVDVRTLLDGHGNTDAEYKLNIARVTSFLENGEKVVICCKAGISRSNAIALMVLMKYYKMDYYYALGLIEEKVPIARIDMSHLDAAKRMFKVQPPIGLIEQK